MMINFVDFSVNFQALKVTYRLWIIIIMIICVIRWSLLKIACLLKCFIIKEEVESDYQLNAIIILVMYF